MNPEQEPVPTAAALSSAAPTTPLPVPTGQPGSLLSGDLPRFVLIFGGTFDPPHRGHIELPVRVRDELERRLDAIGTGWLVYVPAARSPHKPGAPMASDQDRLDMLRLALGDAKTPRATVWTDEIDRAHGSTNAGQTPAPSYSVDTVFRARAWLDAQPDGGGGVSVFLLIGADQAMSFHRWRDPRDLLRLAKPVVMVRGEESNAEHLLTKLAALGYWKPAELAMWREAVVPVGLIDISATLVREALAVNSPTATIGLVSDSVAMYIKSKRLYCRE